MTIDLVPILPLILLAADIVLIMLIIGFYRRHALSAWLAGIGLIASCYVLLFLDPSNTQITPLFIVDDFARFYWGLILLATLAVVLQSYGYLKHRDEQKEEYYLLLLLAALGSAILAASSHFASFFLGLELLSVSLYALLGFTRTQERSVEAATKYLVLAAVSTGFLLFGMALIYAETGTMEFSSLTSKLASGGGANLYSLAGLAMMFVGIGFKLAVVPFHWWTPDVYEGAPAPVTAFVATVSKGGMFALLLRFSASANITQYPSIIILFTGVAIASMFVGNWLALQQNNVKRILAYSSIAHLGYLLVAFLASGSNAVLAATFYLVAYFITTLGAFGVIALLSTQNGEADSMENYRGLGWHRPWIAAALTAMLFSLAGIPLTAGFVGKFYVVVAGVGSALWLLVIVLVVNSAIGLYYYLRIVVAMYSHEESDALVPLPSISLAGSAVLAALTLLLVWLGVYPAPLMKLLQVMVR